MIFDGREFASAKQNELAEKVSVLKKKGITPKLVSIIVGENPVSVLYVGLKKKAAERIRCKMLIIRCKKEITKQELIKKIQNFSSDSKIHGIMVQLPLPANFSKEDRDEILETIDSKKDVDGLRKESKFVTPVVKAVLYALEEGMKTILPLRVRPCKVVVVGATGFEGRRIYRVLDSDKRFVIEGADSGTKDLGQKTKNAYVIISATGVAGLIKKNMIKDGSIIIDVGSPKGDIERNVYERAGFVTPVPGGIGPMTISCLLENLVEASFKA